MCFPHHSPKILRRTLLCANLGETERIKEITLWITNLISLVVDAICQWVGPHANIEVSITEPLHCLLHVGDRPQSNLNPGQRREKHSSDRAPNITGLCHYLVDTSGYYSLNTNTFVSIYCLQQQSENNEFPQGGK